jgi:hypothetical protein
MSDEMENDEVFAELEANTLPSSEFVEMYGFEHNCHCASDWVEGRTGLVAECYTELCDDALTQCHTFKGKIAELERTASVLRVQVGELGGEPRV